MTIELVTKFLPYVDELFTQESKKPLVSNQDFDWDGATAVRIFSIGTAPMNDYDRNGTGCHWSRYGEVQDLDGTTQLMPLKKDRSFTFAIDRLDENETLQSLAATSALARQLRQVTIPEVDSYTYSVMAGRGASVVRVPTVRLPDGCGFMMCHPSATVAPTKLESFKIHSAPPAVKADNMHRLSLFDLYSDLSTTQKSAFPALFSPIIWMMQRKRKIPKALRL